MLNMLENKGLTPKGDGSKLRKNAFLPSDDSTVLTPSGASEIGSKRLEMGSKAFEKAPKPGLWSFLREIALNEFFNNFEPFPPRPGAGGRPASPGLCRALPGHLPVPGLLKAAGPSLQPPLL